MVAKRFSRGTPMVPSVAQQQALLDSLKHDKDLAKNISAILGVDIMSLKAQERIEALQQYQESGYAKAILNQVARADRELREEGERRTGDLSKDDRIRLLEVQIVTEREAFEIEIAKVTERFGLKENPVKKSNPRKAATP